MKASWLTRALAPIAPSWALRRANAERLFKAYYEGGEPSRTHKSRKTGSADAAVQRAGTRIRDAARELEENYDVASGALDVLVNHSVGDGIFPEPLVEMQDGTIAQEFNDELLRLWDNWIHACEVTGQHDYYSLTRLVARSVFRDGEVFGRHLTGSFAGLQHGTEVPFSLEAFEADFVPLEYEVRDRAIRQGIQLNAWGRPEKYFLHRQHPGDRSALLTSTTDLRSLDATSVMHVKMTSRLHQLRGVSVFASVLNRFDDLKEIDENERVASRVAAAMAAFIKKGLPELYEGAPSVGADGKPEPRVLQFEPGIVFDDLLPGEDVGTISSNRPNNALIPFRDAQLRSAAAGLKVSYSSLSKNFDGTYSAQRQELVEQFVTYRALSSFLVFRWCQPVWDGFVGAALLTKRLKLDGVNLNTLFNVTHSCPPMAWIDPVKEMEANVMAEENLYDSKSSIIRKGGRMPGAVWREIARERQALEEFGISERSSGESRSRRSDETEPDPAEGQRPTSTARALVRVSSVRRQRR